MLSELRSYSVGSLVWLELPQKLPFTIHEDRTLVDKALASGALGYVLKTRAHTDLTEAVQEALEGRCYVSSPLRR